jgi:hypothetical protein
MGSHRIHPAMAEVGKPIVIGCVAISHETDTRTLRPGIHTPLRLAGLGGAAV